VKLHDACLTPIEPPAQDKCGRKPVRECRARSARAEMPELEYRSWNTGARIPELKRKTPGLKGEETGRHAMREFSSSQRREGIKPTQLSCGSASGGTKPIHAFSVSVVITPQRIGIYK
jgi:hypothetical protein